MWVWVGVGVGVGGCVGCESLCVGVYVRWECPGGDQTLINIYNSFKMANNHRAVKYLPDNYPEANSYKTIFGVSVFHSYTKMEA